MTIYWIYVVIFSCFSQVFPIGFGQSAIAPLDLIKGEESSGDDPNHGMQNVKDTLNMLKLYKEQDDLDVHSRSLPSSCPTYSNSNGIHIIKVFGLEPFQVVCNSDLAGPGWTVIASRSNKEMNFFRGWKDYKNGFGNLMGDFFIGLDKLHAITATHPQELYVYLEDFDGNKRFARYDEFLIGNETYKYEMLKLGKYMGDMGDSLSYHKNRKFTTLDNDNDISNRNCAIDSMGAWWYGACTDSNLFGQYIGGYHAQGLSLKGMCWYAWRKDLYTYKEMRMMVKPKFSC